MKQKVILTDTVCLAFIELKNYFRKKEEYACSYVGEKKAKSIVNT